MIEMSGNRLGEELGYDHDQPHAHVENTKHFRLIHTTEPLKPGENGGNRPRPALELDRKAFREDSWRIVDQAATSNMGDCMHDLLDAIVAANQLHGSRVD